ncbi:MAG: hypothetical protein CVV52_07790 [Spirochaetae bacterium HGW-Spirochaetae-8]|jgi:DNA-binding NtrC family response regulator|nr:MAG: hypothetical protein CVV52_07790 [Spirochaetae bacterium HGW-Spirochaetae-8]
MSFYLFTKDVKFRALVNHELTNSCISAISMEQALKIQSSLAKDAHPVIVIDENFSEPTLAVFLENLAFHRIHAKKILLVSPLTPKRQLTFTQEHHLLYLSKPFAIKDLLCAIIHLAGTGPLKEHLAHEQLVALEACLQGEEDPFASILIGQSKAMMHIRHTIRQIDGRFTAIHVNGESGTGKEIVADLLFMTTGIKKPMVVENCAAFTGGLHDSRLFGHVRGAFTDAKENRDGLVMMADQGVLFLDEIEVLDLTVQGKLLRLLESGKFRHMGSDQTIISRFKLITASNVSLNVLLEQKKMRSDFYNRINQLIIEIPPLREHKEDIPLLIKHHLDHRGESRELDRDTTRRFMEYDWPGNIRSLFNELDNLITFAGTHDTLDENRVLTTTCLNRKDIQGYQKITLTDTEYHPLSAERHTRYRKNLINETCG